MHDRFVLLQREADLQEKDALLLSLWVKNYPTLGQAHRMKEDFFAIYEANTRQQAQERFAAWEQAITPEIREAFSDLFKAWHHWEPQILAYFDHPVTNAYTEGLNNLTRGVDRLGRGYSFEALRAKMLFAEGAFKRHRLRPKLERLRESETMMREMLHNPTLWRNIPLAIPDSDASSAREINYGVDMLSLSRLMESETL